NGCWLLAYDEIAPAEAHPASFNEFDEDLAQIKMSGIGWRYRAMIGLIGLESELCEALALERAQLRVDTLDAGLDVALRRRCLSEISGRLWGKDNGGRLHARLLRRNLLQGRNLLHGPLYLWQSPPTLHTALARFRHRLSRGACGQ